MTSTLALNLLRRLPKITKTTAAYRVCRHCSSLHSSTSPSKWLLASAVCVERHPVVTKEKTEFEERYLQFIKTQETERSSFSDIEIQEISEKKKSIEALMEGDSKLKKKKKEEETKMNVVDMEYMWEEQLKSFPFADRKTEADYNSDMKSIDRALDKKLVLIVKHKLGGDDSWMLPQAVRTEEETMRETAERTIKLRCGNDLQSRFFGHAPCAYIIQKFPKKIQLSQGVTGVKVFIYKADYMGGQVHLEDDTLDYLWVTLDELPQYLTERYSHRLLKVVVE